MKTNPVLQAIFERRSIRDFDPTPLDKETLETIIEAGIWAPSASNYQPWHFCVIQNKELIDKICDVGKAYLNKNHPTFGSQQGALPGFHILQHAPCVILVSWEKSHHWGNIDSALASQNIMLAAHSLGIGSCYIGRLTPWLESEESCPLLSTLPIPEGYQPINFITLGKPVKGGNKRDRRAGTVSYV
jgi:nitroreductase